MVQSGRSTPRILFWFLVKWGERKRRSGRERRSKVNVFLRLLKRRAGTRSSFDYVLFFSLSLPSRPPFLAGYNGLSARNEYLQALRRNVCCVPRREGERRRALDPVHIGLPFSGKALNGSERAASSFESEEACQFFFSLSLAAWPLSLFSFKRSSRESFSREQRASERSKCATARPSASSAATPATG